MKRKISFLVVAVLAIFPIFRASATPESKPDPNFFIYLCIGQSNMEAGAVPAEQDKDFNNPRFQFMAAVDMPKLGREMGKWYTAIPPICREGNNLGPVDFFGRKMIDILPSEYHVGVINVSVAGAKIQLWDREDYKDYIDNERDWMKNIVSQYGGNPYERLVNMARLAQKDGVIKGILMHQGESNSEDPLWPERVKKIYDNLCKDLNLNPKQTPLLAGELKYAEQGGVCAAFNSSIMPKLPKVLPNAHIISALACDSVFFGWTIVRKGDARGSARAVADKPLVKNLKRHYDFDPNDKYDDEQRYKQYSVRFEVKNPGDGFGIAANGFGIAEYGKGKEYHYSNNTQTPSIPAVKDISYDLGLYLRGESYKGDFKVYLEDKDGNLNSNVLAFGSITDEWKKYEGRLKALRSSDSRLCIIADTTGVFYLDFVTLLPEASQLWNDGKDGPFRKDLMQALADLNPTFMRFPGGCASEGPNYFGQVFWKNSIGTPEERIGFRNHWGYWTSQYVGFYEYFLMAESLGATPLPVLNNGVTCQFAGHQYIAPLDTEEDRERFRSIFVQDALDLIEFCNGSVDSKWGSLRAEMGHPEPFGLKYLGIGNENRGNAFWERFGIIYNAVKEKHPEITIISTSGAFDAGKEFDANMKEIDSNYINTIVDEHYYKSDEWFYTNRDRYNPGKKRGAEGYTYDRNKPTRVFVGEFANNGTNNAYASTLAEAAYWTGLERNSDMVVMAAYAPLFCKKGYNKWNSNLIWFDNRGMWRTSNYYYQKLFSKAGDRAFLMSDVMNGNVADTTVYTSPTINTSTGEIYIKFVNSEAANKRITVNTGSGICYKAAVEFISSHDTSVKNQKDQNYYSSHPDYNKDPMENVSPGKRERPGMREMAWRYAKKVSYTEVIVPHTVDLGIVKKKFEFIMPENSAGIIRLKPLE